jgi:hypothetical protein
LLNTHPPPASLCRKHPPSVALSALLFILLPILLVRSTSRFDIKDPYILLTGATGFNTTSRLLLFLYAYSVPPPKGLGEHVITVVVNNLNITLLFAFLAPSIIEICWMLRLGLLCFEPTRFGWDWTALDWNLPCLELEGPRD